MTALQVQKRKFQRKIKIWRSNPVLFVQDLFNAQPEKWQEKALQSLVRNDYIAIRSGHGVGKTTFLAWAILWWLITRYPVKIACTSPTAHQLSDILWGEISKWRNKLHPAIKKMIEVTSDRVNLKTSGKSSFAVARTARKEQPEAFQGFHSDNMLFIIDEASGVDDIIFEVAQGALSTEGAKVIMTGNPTRNQGFFYRAFHEDRAQWECLHVSSHSSSQVNHDFLAQMEDMYGKDSQVYRIRVLGEFPTADLNTVIPLDECELAAKATPVENDHLYPVWGLDVARFGQDRTCLIKRQGTMLLDPIQVWQNKDTMQIVGLVIDEYNQTDPQDRPHQIYVDVIGIGAGVVDRLAELGYPVHGVNVCEQASSHDRYHRLRDELWFKAKEWFAGKNVSILNNNELIQDLISPTYSFMSNGKIKVESKDELKKRGIKSPDLADAFCLTFAGYHDIFKDQDDHSKNRYQTKHQPRSWMSQ